MPPIRSMSCADDLIAFTDAQGIAREITGAQVRLAAVDVAQAEARINTVLLPAIVADYQMQVHVTSLNPLKLNLIAADAGVSLRSDWWVK
jgi:hypothetical protein